MLLTITNTLFPSTGLGYLLHKHPDKFQSFELSFGQAHVFYPECQDAGTTVALLLDVDPVGLVRGKNREQSFLLSQYVNDRPYVASSLLSVAISQVFSSAMNGRCKDKPELVSVPMPLEAEIVILPVRGGEALLRQLFEPLGYQVKAEQYPTDPVFPEWGMSRYFTVRLSNRLTVQQLLSHLYILIPVCDNNKHYWIGEHEIEKLLEKGKDWLPSHPARELITRRYLKHQTGLTNKALSMLMTDEGEEDTEEEETKAEPEQKQRAHEGRLLAVLDELLNTGAKRVVDLGCGEGKLLKLLLPKKQFEFILGMDVSYRSVEIAKDKLKTDRLSPVQHQRIQLIQGSLTYRDKRIEGFDAAALVEVIEHLDEPRLVALEKSVFQYARPKTVIITTPNAEYNKLFTDYQEGQMRHSDHRFEWTRAEFEAWGNRIADTYRYVVVYKPVGEEQPEVGALSQMGIFTINN